MDEIGVMLYGYDRETAGKIADHLENVLGRRVVLISGSGREDMVVSDILDDEEYDLWEGGKETKILMFLGFDGPSINASMDSFPDLEGQERPIFCTPTEENVGWTLADLLKDLSEEHQYFRNRKKQSGPRNET